MGPPGHIVALPYTAVPVHADIGGAGEHQDPFVRLQFFKGFSCGTPGIVFRATASPELITPETGFVVEQGDVEGILSAVAEIRSRGKAAFSSACRARALACFDKRERWADYLSLYESA